MSYISFGWAPLSIEALHSGAFGGDLHDPSYREPTRTEGLVLLNGDDPNVLWMRGESRSSALTCGFQPHNRIRACDYRLRWPEGASFRVEGEGIDPVEVASRLVGRRMVFPLLAAFAIAHRAGVPMPELLRNLASFSPCRMRLQPVRLKNGAFRST